MDWYYSDGRQPFGPVPDAELDRLIGLAVITPQTLVWRAGMANWVPYGSIAHERVAAAPYTTPTVPTAPIGYSAPEAQPQAAMQQPDQLAPAAHSSLEAAPMSAFQPYDPQAGIETKVMPAYQPQAPANPLSIETAPITAYPGQPVASSNGQSAAGVAAAPAPVAYCSECGTAHPTDDLLAIGPARVCANCKDRYLQRLREGALPGGITRQREYAGFWIRVLAAIIDGVLVAMVNFAIQIVLGLAVAVVASNSAPVRLLFSSLVFLIEIAFACMWESWFIVNHGATPGKLILSLQVICSDGSRPGWSVAIGRHFAKWLSAIILGFGYIMAGIDDEKRALHDRICDTRVVKK